MEDNWWNEGKLMEKKAEDKEMRWKGRLSEKGYLNNGGIKGEVKVLEITMMKRGNLTLRNGLRTATVSTWTELIVHVS